MTAYNFFLLAIIALFLVLLFSMVPGWLPAWTNCGLGIAVVSGLLSAVLMWIERR